MHFGGGSSCGGKSREAWVALACGPSDEVRKRTHEHARMCACPHERAHAHTHAHNHATTHACNHARSPRANARTHLRTHPRARASKTRARPQVLDAREDEMCVYVLTMQSPSACKPQRMAELRRELGHAEL